MPVNSFDDYPMSWRPERKQLAKPLYLAIAKLLEHDIISGKLSPHTKLPPQRELADFLDVNLSTITRAFKLCELKGLLYATTGKGTFVSPSINMPNVLTSHEPAADLIEMGIIKPFYQQNSIVLEAAKSVLLQDEATSFFEYSEPLGTNRQKQAALKWLARFQLHVKMDNIAIASGAQNALTIVLTTLFKPGDKIVTDLFTHPNFKNLATLLNIQLVSVCGDQFGMSPDVLDSICRTSTIKGIYLMPSYSNPTNVTISMERRETLAAIIAKHNLTLIEDDVYSFMLPKEFLPIATFIPDRAIYLCGTSKSLSPGLRVAFMTFPDVYRSQIISGIYNINLKTPSLNVEIISHLIHSGAAETIITKKITLAAERNELFRSLFPNFTNYSNSLSFFQWLPLPENANGSQFEELARRHGVLLFCSDRFAVGATAKQGFFRLAISSPTDCSELRRGLEIVKMLLEKYDELSCKADFIV